MEIVKVIVKGELPEACLHIDINKGCDFAIVGGGDHPYWCEITGKDIDDPDIIPDWCPLVSTKVLEKMYVDLQMYDGYSAIKEIFEFYDRRYSQP